MENDNFFLPGWLSLNASQLLRPLFNPLMESHGYSSHTKLIRITMMTAITIICSEMAKRNKQCPMETY